MIKEIQNKFYILGNKQNYKLDEINYVAIGDSFSAGHNSKFGFCSNGNLKDNEITGLSYPSFFANYLQKYSSSNLKSFDNLSVPLSNINFWIALAEHDKHKLTNYQNIIDFTQTSDWNVTNPFNNFFSSYFNNWNIAKNDFKIVNKKISEANLITITLGLNDLIEKFPYFKINLLKDKNVDYEQIINDIIVDLDKIFLDIKNNYIKLIKTIKSLSSKSYIILIPYVKPFIKINKAFSEIFYIYNEKLNFSLYDYTFEKFSQLEREVANATQINYINTYDVYYWNENNNFLAENIFSMNPTEKGYKKIAMDLFVKLFLDKEEFNYQIHSKNFYNKYLFDYNENYWKNGLDSFVSPFAKKTNNFELFTNIYGQNINFNLLKSNNLENKYQNYLSSYLKIAPYIENYVRYYKKDICYLIKKWVELKFINKIDAYKSIQKLLLFLDDEQKVKDLILLFLKNGKLEKILFKLQNDLNIKLNKLGTSYITLFIFKSTLKNILQNDQKISYDVVKQIFDSKVIEKNIKEFKLLTNLFVRDSLETDILEYIYGFKLNAHYKKIRNYLASLNSFIEITNYLVESITNHSLLYSPLKSYDEFWKHWIINNKYKMLYLLDKLFIEISSDNLINKTTEFIYETITLNINQDEMIGKDQRTIKFNIKQILIDLRDNPKNLNSLFINFINKLKTYSIFNIIAKKTKQKNIFNIKNWIGINNLLFLILKLAKRFLIIKKALKKYK